MSAGGAWWADEKTATEVMELFRRYTHRWVRGTVERSGLEALCTGFGYRGTKEEKRAKLDATSRGERPTCPGCCRKIDQGLSR